MRAEILQGIENEELIEESGAGIPSDEEIARLVVEWCSDALVRLRERRIIECVIYPIRKLEDTLV